LNTSSLVEKRRKPHNAVAYTVACTYCVAR